MKHVETYIEVLKRGRMQRGTPSAPPVVDLPGLKQPPGLSNVRKYELREERKQLIGFIDKKEKELKKAKGNERNQLSTSIKVAKGKLKELSLILGPLEKSSDAK